MHSIRKQILYLLTLIIFSKSPTHSRALTDSVQAPEVSMSDKKEGLFLLRGPFRKSVERLCLVNLQLKKNSILSKQHLVLALLVMLVPDQFCINKYFCMAIVRSYTKNLVVPTSSSKSHCWALKMEGH